MNRQVALIDSLNQTSRTTYDINSNVMAQTDPLGRVTTFTYDNLNRQIALTTPLGHTTTTSYDAAGRTISIRNALGETTTYTYDLLDRQTGVTNALGQTTLSSYDDRGNLLSLTDPSGNTTRYSYDALDRLLTETNELDLTRHFSYDRMGNLVESVDRNGQVRTYLYDALNRQVRETWLDSSGNSLNQFRTTYDAAGRSISTSDSHSSYQYDYDGANRLVQVTNTGSAGVPTVVFNYSYDAVGNRTQATDSINGIVRGSTTYRYDELNRTVQILQSGSGMESKRVDMGYDAASQLTTLTRYNDLAGTEGVQSTYTYDAGGRLVDLTHQQGSTTLAQYRYSYDAANRITRMTSPEGDNTFNYDSTGQLTGADFSYQNDEAYSYDANGNRTNAGYQTGINNRLLSDGTYTYAYDNNGNLIQQTDIATGQITRLKWDHRNRLIGVVEQDATGTILMQADYRYDVLNRRIAKTVDPDGVGSQSATTERYVYDGEHIVLVFDEDGVQQERYLHGPMIDQVLAGEVAGETQWALTDHQGTVRQVVDESGSVVNQVSYDSFGTITNQTNPTAFFRFGYTGREHDLETGYTYYRNRYTFNGRFISEDPIGFEAGDPNLYRYVGNSPHNFTDPSGLKSNAPVRGKITKFNRRIFYNAYSNSIFNSGPLPGSSTDITTVGKPAGYPVGRFGRIEVFSDTVFAAITYADYTDTRRTAVSGNYGGLVNGDDAGHIVPHVLGGSDKSPISAIQPFENNFFSQNRNKNRGEYARYNRDVSQKFQQFNQKDPTSAVDPCKPFKNQPNAKWLAYWVSLHYDYTTRPIQYKNYPLRPDYFYVTVGFFSTEKGRVDFIPRRRFENP